MCNGAMFLQALGFHTIRIVFAIALLHLDSHIALPRGLILDYYNGLRSVLPETAVTN